MCATINVTNPVSSPQIIDVTKFKNYLGAERRFGNR